ncbi:hypothetical protein LRA02_24190 [Lentilactobacillus rapi]|uniref:Uncharacterized protein n=1 Tax=Lentilactobacillus rapi TaxID=481723 RepID=A0A512PQU8_9LACO|nr:hypothetical protein LRA02_24190 [Lentilactobacillus rapi]
MLTDCETLSINKLYFYRITCRFQAKKPLVYVIQFMVYMRKTPVSDKYNLMSVYKLSYTKSSN